MRIADNFVATAIRLIKLHRSFAQAGQANHQVNGCSVSQPIKFPNVLGFSL
jgi:hypothetical protein